MWCSGAEVRRRVAVRTAGRVISCVLIVVPLLTRINVYKREPLKIEMRQVYFLLSLAPLSSLVLSHYHLKKQIPGYRE